MIRTMRHAKAVHARRREAGLPGIGKAVRRFLKRSGLYLDAIG